MIARFADTAYYLALINPSDVAYQIVTNLTRGDAAPVVTTSAVLNELGNHLRVGNNRRLFVDVMRQLQFDPDVRIVHVDERLFQAGIDFFDRRPDQAWSLTDCVSFVVMRENGLTEALTTDHHFEQAGFNVLLKP